MTVSRDCPEGKVVLVLDSTSTSMVSPGVLFFPKAFSTIYLPSLTV